MLEVYVMYTYKWPCVVSHCTTQAQPRRCRAPACVPPPAPPPQRVPLCRMATMDAAQSSSKKAKKRKQKQSDQQRQEAATLSALAAAAAGGELPAEQAPTAASNQSNHSNGVTPGPSGRSPSQPPATAAADEDMEDAPQTSGRHYTLSMAVPGSIIDNTQNLELATFVAGQIARTAAIFNVDEVVVVDDTPQRKDGTVGSGAAFLARVVQFMETPQYLRKALVAMHPDLRLAGLLPPLDAPHHLRQTEWKPYREGVVQKRVPGLGSFVDIGLDRTAFVRQQVAPGARVTLLVGEAPVIEFMQDYGESMIIGEVVSPSEPRERHGMYWGYTTRLAKGVAGMVRECPYEGGYDLKVGTSEHGEQVAAEALVLPSFQHLLVAFGGLQGLEDCIEQDKKLRGRDVSEVFDIYLNTCAQQGSRTIRTEEAVLISLTFLQGAISKFGRQQPVAA